MNKFAEAMPWIKPLPERVINKIAAGEVIERPAAVVKELVENSIDSGADNISIIIEKSGSRLIKIVDNGCGIPEDQIEIAFSRHATSKIRNFDDLNELYTYGFRGEALPSIASISRMRMVSRPRDAETGVEIIYEGGVLQSKKPVAAPFGTTIEVENLFYNTPVRRKFLKAETTEARHISRTAMGMAIGRYDIGFSFSLNDRNMFSLPKDSALSDRVSGVLGGGKLYVEVKGETDLIKLHGYIGLPQTVQQNRNSQFIFINNRLIQSSTISHALMAGYGELIPRGKFPIGALLLQVDYREVDVNVHPTKAEVRLSHEREIHDDVYRIVRDSLRRASLIPDFKQDHKISKEKFTDNAKPSFDSHYHHNNNETVLPGMNDNAEVSPDMLKELYQSSGNFDFKNTNTVNVDISTGEIVNGTSRNEDQSKSSQPDSEGFRFIGRLMDLYLLMQMDNNLYVVDQHTAHERVLYEETLEKVEKKTVDGQNLLFPIQVELDPQQMALFDEIVSILNDTGFKVEHFGGRTVNIESVPAIIRKKSPEKFFLAVIDDIASLKKSGHEYKKAMAQSIACRSAVMAGDRMTDEEAIHLLKRLNRCRDKYSCPHGRPTFVKLSKQDLDRQFGRK